MEDTNTTPTNNDDNAVTGASDPTDVDPTGDTDASTPPIPESNEPHDVGAGTQPVTASATPPVTAHFTSPETQPRPRTDRWTRPRTGRILAGVAAGIAHRTQLPLWFVRATFVVTAIAGGFGLAAYLAAWALMPQEGEHAAAADEWKERFDRADSPSKKLGLGLIALGVVVALGSTGILSSPLALAALLVVAGLALTRPSAEH